MNGRNRSASYGNKLRSRSSVTRNSSVVISGAAKENFFSM